MKPIPIPSDVALVNDLLIVALVVWIILGAVWIIRDIRREARRQERRGEQ
jgi:hypothetical protein